MLNQLKKAIQVHIGKCRVTDIEEVWDVSCPIRPLCIHITNTLDSNRLINPFLTVATGGAKVFQIYCQELGDTLVSNGKIALLLYARLDDIKSGALKLPEHGGKGRVASGVDLVFSRFHNKGVVGLALQYYDTAVAFLVAHFASDSGGRKRWERRDEVRVDCEI